MKALSAFEQVELQKENKRLKELNDELVDALKTILQIEVTGYQLQDRLQFSSAGREIYNKATQALAKCNPSAT